MPVPSSSITQLQSQWFQLSDLDRAQAVAAIRRSGTSIRQIALGLKFSESLLRHLLLARQAPPEDQALARQGRISTNELVRRSKAANIRRAERHRQAIALQRNESARKGADLICSWLLRTGLHRPSCEMIVDEVRRQLAMQDAVRSLPATSQTITLPVDKIIRHCKPPELADDSIDIVAWYAAWLCRWALYAFPDADVRDQALDQSLNGQWRR